MKASIVDLRYKTTDILKALDRNESVTVLYHGKVKGIIKPVRGKSISKVKDHPFFAMHKGGKQTVLEALENLRKPRYDL
ncbi:MAG: type II toxin-antitoxin system Phd/YefM family antitoxin [Methylococcales symbiont of Hymedesmia sp. n. MRB-2018]|nr:MAG: type II toxin-antitoxin system Phd/YefM family antitoxin [Methylococcales symbiont of Hymedesmia sp. n. MRB-2018]KAF3983460.1 MAG: type II toxin-antitoxin system Phd/YefM family antitoxin [Methylococcales symbiont of Hymedesmia sp. n. MRB-2018]